MAKRNRGVSAAELAREDATDLAPQPDQAPVDEAASGGGSAAPAARRAPTVRRQPRSLIQPMPERAPMPARQDCVEYLPDPKRHMSQMGLVATGGFICRIDGVRHSVRMGAPKTTIPAAVQKLMAASGVTFGHAVSPVKKGEVGVTVLEDEEDEGGPRARRTHRPEKNVPQRQFRPIRHLPTE